MAILPFNNPHKFKQGGWGNPDFEPLATPTVSVTILQCNRYCGLELDIHTRHELFSVRFHSLPCEVKIHFMGKLMFNCKQNPPIYLTGRQPHSFWMLYTIHTVSAKIHALKIRDPTWSMQTLTAAFSISPKVMGGVQLSKVLQSWFAQWVSHVRASCQELVSKPLD